MKQTGLGELDLLEMMKEPDLLLGQKRRQSIFWMRTRISRDAENRTLKDFVESILSRPIDLSRLLVLDREGHLVMTVCGTS